MPSSKSKDYKRYLLKNKFIRIEEEQKALPSMAVGDPERYQASNSSPVEPRTSARSIRPGEIVWLPAPGLIDAFRRIDSTIDITKFFPEEKLRSFEFAVLPHIVLPGNPNDTHVRLVVKFCTVELRKGLESLLQQKVKDTDAKWFVPDYNNRSDAKFAKPGMRMELAPGSNKPFATGYIFLSVLPKCTIPLDEEPEGGYHVETGVQYSETSVRKLAELVDALPCLEA